MIEEYVTAVFQPYLATQRALQVFLNIFNDADLPITGTFGDQTHNAVISFQERYFDDIIQPWIDAGYPDTAPNGFVYLTTRHTVNTLVCPDATGALPPLTPAQ